MACDSDKVGLSKSVNAGSDSSDKAKRERIRKVRKWLNSWATELSDNGEMLKIWCLRLMKEPGMARCKYCKLKVNYSNKGLSALRCHANTRKHMDNGKLYHLRMSKGSAGVSGHMGPSIKTKKKPSSSNQRPPTHNVKRLSSSSLITTAGQNRVRLKDTNLSAFDAIKAQLNHQHHLKHTILPSDKASPLSPKFSVPILSKKFLQFKTSPSKTPSPFKSGLSSKPHFPFSLSPATSSAVSQHNKTHSNLISPKFYNLPQNKRSLPQFPSPYTTAVVNRLKSSPTPALSLGLGHRHKLYANPNQIYSGANLRATGPPFLAQTVQPPVKLIPVFMCYFCHGEFPSKSCLYEHQEQCTLKLESETTATTITNNNNSSNNIVTVDTSTSSSTPTPASTMDASISTSTFISTKSKPIIKDVSVVIHKLPTTPDNHRKNTNVFFPNLRTPQKSSTPSSTVSLTPSSTVSSSSWTYVNNTVSKPTFLNGLKLLPIKTALQEQKRISRKRRNTECESLDWVEEDELPPTPKTPCTPPTPKLLISHLSREEYRRELTPHRLFRLSSSTSDSIRKSDNDAKEGTKDLGEIGCHSHGDGTKSTHSQNAMDTGSDDTEGKHDGKISVVRSLYNVDVTSPLGQFVNRHYKADPSLHILSDIESHCLTSPSATAKTTNFSLRARNVDYPIMFGGVGRRLLYHDYYHSYKFNKSQVREFMKTANTGLNKDSRRLLRQMKKCQVVLRRISKSDLRYWISSQNDITVNLKYLSLAEIEKWTSPKPSSSSSSSEESDSESNFPDGLKSSSPIVKSVLGLKSKREVRIKTVDMLSSSVLTIANYISEETCADLLSSRKTVYRCLLSDWAQNDSENVDVSNNNSTTSTSQQQQQQQQKQKDNTILRRMLNHRPVLGSCLAGNTLPDITNLTVDKNTVATTGVAVILPKRGQVNPNSKSVVTSKNIREIGDRMFKPEVTKSRSSTRRSRTNLMAENNTATTTTTTTKNNNAGCVNRNVPKPLVSKKSDKDENLDIDEVDSCSDFISFPNPCDLLREKTPSQNSNKSRQSSPEDPISSTCTPTPSTTSVRRRQSDRLRQGPKWSGSFPIEFRPPTSDVLQILSIDNNPELLKPFLEHFRCLREGKEKEAYKSSDNFNDCRCEDLEKVGGNNACSSVRRSDRKCGSPVPKKRKCVRDDDGDGGRVEVLKSFLKSRLKSDDGLKDDDVRDDDEEDEYDDSVENCGDKTGPRVGGEWTGVSRISRLTERRGRSSTVNHQPGNARTVTTRRRKSSPRITPRAKNVGLNRRLSAAGLVKREGSLGSRSLESSISRSPISEVLRSPVSSVSRSPASVVSVSPVLSLPRLMIPAAIASQSDSDSSITRHGGNYSDDGARVVEKDVGLSTKTDSCPTSRPITLVIRKERLAGPRHVDKLEPSPRESPIPKLRIRNCASKKMDDVENKESPASSLVAPVDDDGHCLDMIRSRSSLPETRRAGLPRRRCLTSSPSLSSSSSISSTSSSASSPSGTVLEKGSFVGTSRSAGLSNVSGRRSWSSSVPVSSYHEIDDEDMECEGRDDNMTVQQQPSQPPASLAQCVSKGGLMRFVSSFKLM